MKRPAAAGTAAPVAKKYKSPPGVHAPSWHDAKCRSCILYLSGLKGKGSTRTLSYKTEAQKKEQIKVAEKLVEELSPHAAITRKYVLLFYKNVQHFRTEVDF